MIIYYYYSSEGNEIWGFFADRDESLSVEDRGDKILCFVFTIEASQCDRSQPLAQVSI